MVYSIAQWSITKFVQMKVPGSKIVPCQGVLGSNHSLTFGLFTQVSGSGPLGPLVKSSRLPKILTPKKSTSDHFEIKQLYTVNYSDCILRTCFVGGEN